jgi:hypothetical protein
MGFSFDDLNPFTGFGLLDSLAGHASSKDLQQRGHDFDREMWEKQSAFAQSQQMRSFDISRQLMEKQYGLGLRGLESAPSSAVQGLKKAGLNPILAATGGFKSSAPNVSAPGVGPVGATPSRGGSPGGAKSNIAAASLMESNAKMMDAQARKFDAEAITQTALQEKYIADKLKTLAERDKIEFENHKKSFFAFFWEKFDGVLREFNQAFSDWSKKNGEKVNRILDSIDLTLEDMWSLWRKQFKQYDRPIGRNRSR